MNNIKKISIRLVQKIIYVFSFLIPFNEPSLIKGENSFLSLCKLIKTYNKKNVLLVTDKKLHSLKMDQKVYKELKEEQINYTLFYNIDSNPTVQQVELGVKKYLDNNCDCIVCIGGGSAIDCAKVIGARVSNLNKSIYQMKGLLKVKHKLPLLFAIPTTSGTGSEASIAAVISNPDTNEKFAIEDYKLIPNYAFLNPSLLIKLPRDVTATTGIDALTHAIEAFIGCSNTKKSKENAIKTVKLIHKYLYLSYEDGTNLLYREKMQIASYYAGLAFTRAYVGYVHAIAHTLGGFYNIPHGLANAIILPKVLKAYGEAIYDKLAILYDSIHENNKLSNKEKALKYIDEIISLNEKLNIPSNLKDVIKDEDIPLMIKNAMKESIPLYPTPVLWEYKDFENIYKQLQG